MGANELDQLLKCVHFSSIYLHLENDQNSAQKSEP